MGRLKMQELTMTDQVAWVTILYTLLQKKRSQYTFPHIFSKRGTILTIFAVLMPQ